MILPDDCYILLHADTSDVQVLKLFTFDDSKSLGVQCTFIIGSDAQGCAVVVVSKYYGNYTMKLFKGLEENKVTRIVPFTTDHMHLCHYFEYGVHTLAFDVEMDGSIGSVAVPATYENVNITNIGKFCESMKESGKIA